MKIIILNAVTALTLVTAMHSAQADSALSNINGDTVALATVVAATGANAYKLFNLWVNKPAQKDWLVNEIEDIDSAIYIKLDGLERLKRYPEFLPTTQKEKNSYIKSFANAVAYSQNCIKSLQDIISRQRDTMDAQTLACVEAGIATLKERQRELMVELIFLQNMDVVENNNQ